MGTKFCKYCGATIDEDVIICPKCGKQVEELRGTQISNIVINNSNNNVDTNTNANLVGARFKNKWVALILCFFLGYLGAHKFYEEKAGMGILYLLTVGLFLIGVVIDFFELLFKPNPYMVI